MKTTLLLSSLLLALALSLAPTMAQVEFIPLDKTCGPAFFPTACVVDMSGDGKTLLFRDAIWTEDGGIEPISGPESGWQVVALSDDGSTVVGTVGVTEGPLGPRGEAAIWRGGDQWEALGGLPNTEPCGTFYTSSFDVSGDGSKVVGLAWLSCAEGAHAFEWTEESGMVDLGTIVDDRSSRANAISADGSFIAGWSDSSFGSRLGAYWDMGADPVWFVPDGSEVFVGEAQGVSSDGSIVVGFGYSDFAAGRDLEPWLWTEEGGVVPLGVAKALRGDIADGQHLARDVSDDGRVVIGQSTLFLLGEQWAFLWTEEEGMTLLQDYVRENSDPAIAEQICPVRAIGGVIQCQGWDFWNLAAVSNDGRTIVGTGSNPDGIFQAFMVRLP